MTQSAGRYPILVDPALLFLRHRDPLAVASTVYYHGVVIALDSQGRAAKATGAAGLKIVGFYDGETFTATAADRVSVSNGVIPMVNSSTDPVTIADLKNVVYLESDDTIARTSAGGTLSPCGILELYEDSTPKVQIGGLPPSIVAPSSGSLLLHAPVADQTAMQAIPANERADGMLCVDLTTNLVWQFDAGSAAGASSWVRVPAAGTGRWLRTNAALTDLAATTNGNGASLIGIEDAASNFTATTVEAALAEIISDYAATTNGNGASKVGIEDAGSFTTAANVEAAFAEVYQHLKSAQGHIDLDPQDFYLLTGAPLAIFANGASAVPGSALVDSELFGVRWNNNATLDGIVASFGMPPDADITANATLTIYASKTGATVGDAVTFAVGAFNQVVGALHDADTNFGGTTSAMTGDAAAKTVQAVTLTLALADLAASPAGVTLTIKPTDGTLGTDDLVLIRARLTYKKKLLAS